MRGRLPDAARMVANQKARADQFKKIFSSTHWGPKKLEEEVKKVRNVFGFFFLSRIWYRYRYMSDRICEQGLWIPISVSKELILKDESYWERPLYELILSLLGGRFSLLAREIRDNL